MKTIAEINQKIKNGKAVVVTAEEIIGIVDDKGYEEAAELVDVVTTGTFGPMCSSGVFINFGHSDPPIKMKTVSLNDVPAYAGLAAVDAYIGATEVSTTKGMEYGGGHVIQELVAGKDVKLRAFADGTDCYPRKSIETTINKYNVNQIYMYNPRNAYQNYPAATNSTKKTIYTYMGTLLPEFGNITYSTSGELSPLLNDPYYRTIGLGTRIFLGGGQGYVTWQGTQHNPGQARGENGVPLSLAGTIAVSGDLRDMSEDFIRAAVYEKYGVSLFVGIGIPIPIIDVEMLKYTAVRNSEIKTSLADKSGNEKLPETYTYEQLQSGSVEFRGEKVKTAPLSSISKAREIAGILKEWIEKGDFLLTEAVAPLPLENKVNKLEIREIKL
ncbi:MAG: homocysteine biosynthesis protein [Clostridia bacterium]|nr:homocysteine biosynthesis protein [Clostridia bacterium]MBN2883380.1 homocysteine biosynthesis protein [Clostridia bacterium]